MSVPFRYDPKDVCRTFRQMTNEIKKFVGYKDLRDDSKTFKNEKNTRTTGVRLPDLPARISEIHIDDFLRFTYVILHISRYNLKKLKKKSTDTLQYWAGEHYMLCKLNFLWGRSWSSWIFLQRLNVSDDRTIDILDIQYHSDDVSLRESVDIDTGIQRRIGKHKRCPITCHWIVTFFVSYS